MEIEDMRNVRIVQFVCVQDRMGHYIGEGKKNEKTECCIQRSLYLLFYCIFVSSSVSDYYTRVVCIFPCRMRTRRSRNYMDAWLGNGNQFGIKSLNTTSHFSSIKRLSIRISRRDLLIYSEHVLLVPYSIKVRTRSE